MIFAGLSGTTLPSPLLPRLPSLKLTFLAEFFALTVVWRFGAAADAATEGLFFLATCITEPPPMRLLLERCPPTILRFEALPKREFAFGVMGLPPPAEGEGRVVTTAAGTAL